MPNYKFFAPARKSMSAKKVPHFDEFNLSSSKRQKTSNDTELMKHFKAKKMPDFDKVAPIGVLYPGIAQVP
jgi:hypothetical protein